METPPCSDKGGVDEVVFELPKAPVMQTVFHLGEWVVCGNYKFKLSLESGDGTYIGRLQVGESIVVCLSTLRRTTSATIALEFAD